MSVSMLIVIIILSMVCAFAVCYYIAKSNNKPRRPRTVAPGHYKGVKFGEVRIDEDGGWIATLDFSEAERVD